MNIHEGGKSSQTPPSAAARGKNSGGASEYIRDNVRKLSLWHTRTFKPVATHDELDAIMSTFGFVGLAPRDTDGVTWKEYGYRGTGPRPRLPYPRIDGLHILTYASFLESVGFYLGMENVADVFHVRGMPLHRVYDRNERWKRMEEDEFCVFLYRHGTLDQTVHSFSLRKYQNDIFDVDSQGFDKMLIHMHETVAPTSQIVPLKDIIV